jgi:hypothetical protein
MKKTITAKLFSRSGAENLFPRILKKTSEMPVKTRV